MSITELTSKIKAEALNIGFDVSGIAPAELPNKDIYQKNFDTWLAQGMHAEMLYMQNNIEKRLNPILLVEDAKSVICLLMSYKPEQLQNPNAPKIARYAYGIDYHEVIWAKTTQLLNYIKQIAPEANGRGFTDSAPILERVWAVQAGLGWIGKNATLISPIYGSFTFLAELIVDIELEYDKPYTNNGCGACNRCLANCPTKAICAPKTIDARQCISYQTIENKGEITIDTNGWLFGCDICIQVCPWNKQAPTNNHPEFAPIPQVLNMSIDDWLNMSESEFNMVFKHSPIKRSKFAGIKRNLAHLNRL